MYMVSHIVSIVGSLRDREVACSASDRQGSNFESCVWRTVSSHSSHHPQEVLLAQFSLHVHKGGLKPDSFHFISHIKKAILFILTGEQMANTFIWNRIVQCVTAGPNSWQYVHDKCPFSTHAGTHIWRCDRSSKSIADRTAPCVHDSHQNVRVISLMTVSQPA